MILPIYASIERLDLRLVEAAKDLYSSSTQAFLRVTLPLTAPGIVAGVLLTFIPAFGDYVNAALLGGTNQAMIGNRIQSLYLIQRDYPEAAALSFLMMALILVVVLLYIRLAGTEAFMGEEEEAQPDGLAAATTRCASTPGLAVALHADPDRGDRGLLLRRRRRRTSSTSPSTTASRSSTGSTPSPIEELNDALLHLARAGGALDRDLDRDRDADGARPGPPPVLRPPRGQPADRAADGDARDRDRRRAALDVHHTTRSRSASRPC